MSYARGEQALLFLTDIERHRELSALAGTGEVEYVSLQEHGANFRLATPQHVTGLSDVVSNPVHATGVGLLLYGSQADSGRSISGSAGGDTLLDRIQSWFRGEF